MSESRAAGPADVQPDGFLTLDAPVVLPPVLDVLIVGGGPFGTATAFRARELGLAALVVDYDDLMKRIRDYAKDKQILPDYGGGDRMQFPNAGPLIAALHFAPIDKDQMCREWKALYRRHSVPAQIGVELTGLERDGDAWRAVTWNHNTKSEQILHAKHVVLAFGRGVPRRLDVPGDVAGLAFGLTDAARYVGQPACVIGGGTSAGEAVIAISNAKTAAGDPSAVYWSYRGDKMPKVSKALADVFFDAFMGNGNIRYLPGSEPVAIVDSGGEACLSLRTARVTTPGQPTSTTQLEFSKKCCIACIGEDIPEALLARVGVPLVAGGPSNKSRCVVTPLLETRQPNVYLAGDVLSPAYFETTDFDGDPSQFAEVKRRGNIKAAMRDGVLIAEVIAQKLAGRVQIDVRLNFDEPAAPAPVPVVPAPVAAAPPVASLVEPRPAVAPPPALIEPPPAAVPVSVRPAVVPPPATPAPHTERLTLCSLVLILPSGVEANEYPLKPVGPTTIGRMGADIAFPDDGALADVHASIVAEGDAYLVRDEGSEGGVLLQAAPDRPIELARGAMIRAGRQWLVVGDRRSATTLSHYGRSGQRLATFELRDGPTIVGRQSPDITLAPDDASLSRRHLVLTLRDGRVSVKDLGSANGTQVRVTSPMRLTDGDRLILGQQVLAFRDDRASRRPAERVSLDTSMVGRPFPRPAPPPAPVAPLAPGKAAAMAPVVPAAAPAPVPTPAPGRPAADAAAASGPGVYFEGLNRLAPCEKGQTICQAAEKAGIRLEADCHQGVCGMDPVKVLSGGEHLNALTATERSTLEDLCSVEPGPHRLACMARVNGPVRVQVVKT